MNHPLTDEIIRNNFTPEYDRVKYGDEDLGDICLGFSDDDLRAAADWQLDECIEELKFLLSVFGVKGLIREEAIPIIAELFKSNMRPQEDT